MIHRFGLMDLFLVVCAVETLIASYFEVVRKNVLDAVPKAIMCFLVSRRKLDAQSVLVHHLYQPHLFERLLQEADDVGAKRQACTELAASLRKCLQIVNRIRDNSSNSKQISSEAQEDGSSELSSNDHSSARPADAELQAVAELSRRDYTQQP